MVRKTVPSINHPVSETRGQSNLTKSASYRSPIETIALCLVFEKTALRFVCAFWRQTNEPTDA